MLNELEDDIKALERAYSIFSEMSRNQLALEQKLELFSIARKIAQVRDAKKQQLDTERQA